MTKSFINLHDKLDDPSIIDLLNQSGYPVEIQVSKSLQILECYKSNSEWLLIGSVENGELTGLIGVEGGNDLKAEIKHIVVSENYRKKGVASSLVKHVIVAYRLNSIYAETDSDAVGFYQNLNFEVKPLGQKIKNIERFACCLKVAKE